jgi:UDPglucose 6-dehydrogenase
MHAVERRHNGPIGVIGLWHLGSVTAACLANAGNLVVGVDPDLEVVRNLLAGRPPVSEPGLEQMLAQNVTRLHFSSDPRALAAARCAWLTFDTPVADDDKADVEWVLANAVVLLAQLPEDSLVVVSSQLPVGSIATLAERCAAARGDGGLRFACVPENLRLGSALESFGAPERIVAGVRSERDRIELSQLLAPFCSEIQWMRVESAEMTKHALNGFLATSVAFINEIAAICESVGADAEEVSRGLRSERRIGPRAYLGPGDAFAGGTLARDISFLRVLAQREGLSAHVFAGVADGNAAHKHWTQRKLLQMLGANAPGKLLELLGGDPPEQDALRGRRVAIWGLTYKPGTDTLRRSSAIELCRWLVSVGATVQAHDPAVEALPAGFALKVELCVEALDAAADADALVICTPWPDYLDVPVEDLLAALAQPQVIDPAGALQATLGHRQDVRYVRVGAATELLVSSRTSTTPVEEAHR